MKRLIAVAVFVAAGVVGGGSSAHGQQPQVQTIQFGGFQQRGSCNINGIVYPLAMDYSVWGHDGNNRWFAIGSVTWVRFNRWLFVGNDGEQFEVVCW